MIFEVQYKHKKDAANRNAVIHMEFFESDEVPDKTTVIGKLTEMRKDFAESTVTISKSQRSCVRVTQL